MMQTTASPTLVGTAHHIVMREWNRHKGTGTEKKTCIKRSSIVSVKKKKEVNFGIFSPPVVHSGILVIQNQKNKACIIVSGNARVKGYHLIQNPCTVFMYISYTYMVPFLRGFYGLPTCSHWGTVSSVIYTWSLDSPCKKVCAGKYIWRMEFQYWQLLDVTTICLVLLSCRTACYHQAIDPKGSFIYVSLHQPTHVPSAPWQTFPGL